MREPDFPRFLWTVGKPEFGEFGPKSIVEDSKLVQAYIYCRRAQSLEGEGETVCL